MLSFAFAGRLLLNLQTSAVTALASKMLLLLILSEESMIYSDARPWGVLHRGRLVGVFPSGDAPIVTSEICGHNHDGASKA